MQLKVGYFNQFQIFSLNNILNPLKEQEIIFFLLLYLFLYIQ